MNTKSFYDTIRAKLFSGSISTDQFNGLEHIIAEYGKESINDLRQLAYVLATIYHETAKTMKPIAEYGKGANYAYGKKFKMGGGSGKRIAYTTPDHIYYGRGYVQLTWFENYEAMGKKIGVDLLNNPDLLLTVDVSTKICFVGMRLGMFTGKKLSDYFNATKTDWINARRIINGTDAADRIGGYAKTFYDALTLA